MPPPASRELATDFAPLLQPLRSRTGRVGRNRRGMGVRELLTRELLTREILTDRLRGSADDSASSDGTPTDVPRRTRWI